MDWTPKSIEVKPSSSRGNEIKKIQWVGGKNKKRGRGNECFPKTIKEEGDLASPQVNWTE